MSRERPGRRWLIWAAAAICLVVGSPAGAQPRTSPAPVPPRAGPPKAKSRGAAQAPTTSAELLALFRSQPTFGEPFVLLHDDFPDEWDTFSAKVLSLASPRAIGEYLDAYLSDFFAQRLNYVAVAPSPNLRAVAISKAVLLIQLQKTHGFSACAAYATNGGVDSPTDDDLKAMADVSSAYMRAIRQGMDHPADYADISDSDSAVLAKGFLSHGGDPKAWAAIYEGESDKLDPPAQCAAWIAFYTALGEAPEPVAGRWGAWFFGPDDENDDDTLPDTLGAPTVS